MNLKTFQNYRVYLDKAGISDTNIQRNIISAYLRSSSGKRIEDFVEKYKEKCRELPERVDVEEGNFCLSETKKDLATLVMIEVFG
ncbi:MAG: hypothetical protein KJ566_01685 [Nanoarchaeota archaeon]|nr:hypothetical protein [Nanoarchaeota archaeon]